MQVTILYPIPYKDSVIESEITAELTILHDRCDTDRGVQLIPRNAWSDITVTYDNSIMWQHCADWVRENRSRVVMALEESLE